MKKATLLQTIRAIDWVISTQNCDSVTYDKWYTVIGWLLSGTNSECVSEIPSESVSFMRRPINNMLNNNALLLSALNKELEYMSCAEYDFPKSRFEDSE